MTPTTRPSIRPRPVTTERPAQCTQLEERVLVEDRVHDRHDVVDLGVLLGNE